MKVIQEPFMSNLLRTEPVGVASAKLKEKLGDYLSRTERGEVFRIMRHDRDSAVLLSWETFQQLLDAVPDPLAELRGDFDRLVERMQTPEATAAGDALFAASGADIGAVAAAQAREDPRAKLLRAAEDAGVFGPLEKGAYKVDRQSRRTVKPRRSR